MRAIRSFRSFSAAFSVLTAAAQLCACEDKPAPTTGTASATAAPVPAPTASAPPQKPQLAVDDTAAFVSGIRVDLTQPDPRGRFATVLDGKPVVNEELVLEANRDAKTPKVALVVASVAKANAKALVVHTPKRDRSAASISLSLHPKWDPCTAVAMINKDGSIVAQTAAGGGGARFTRGMAGPDLTRGSEGVKKLSAACDSPVWMVGADDSITWGLVVDLILAVSGGDEGGAPARAKEVVFLTTAPTAGKKVEASE